MSKKHVNISTDLWDIEKTIYPELDAFFLSNKKTFKIKKKLPKENQLEITINRKDNLQYYLTSKLDTSKIELKIAFISKDGLILLRDNQQHGFFHSHLKSNLNKRILLPETKAISQQIAQTFVRIEKIIAEQG